MIDHNTNLFNAVNSSDFDAAKSALESGASPNCIDSENQFSVLIIASQLGHTPLVKLLLEKGADVNAQNTDGCSPLWVAAAEGHTDVVKLLLEKGAYVNAQNTDGRSPLWVAASEERTDVVTILCQYGANPFIQDVRGNKPIDKTEQQSELYNTLYTYQTHFQNLFNFAYQGQTEELKNLLQTAGISINVKHNSNESLLYVAAAEGHTGVVKLLLEKGADINSKDTNGESPLILAARENKIDVIKLLLESGADINLQDRKNKDTALHWATCKGHTEIVALLCQYGANPFIKDKNQNIAIEKTDNSEITSILSSHESWYNFRRHGGCALMPIVLPALFCAISSNPMEHLMFGAASIIASRFIFSGTASRESITASQYFAATALYMAADTVSAEYAIPCKIASAAVTVLATYFAAKPYMNTQEEEQQINV